MNSIILFIFCSLFSLFLICSGLTLFSSQLAVTDKTAIRCALFLSFQEKRPFFVLGTYFMQLIHMHCFLFLLLQFISSFLFYFSCHLLLQNTLLGLFAFVWSICSITLTVTDIFYYLLPNNLLLLFGCLAFLYHISVHPQKLFYYLGSSLVLFLLFYCLFLFHPEGLGGGDVKLAALIGFAFGYSQSILALLVSCIAALLYGLFLYFNEIDSHRPIPFGPFLFLGTWVLFLIKLR